VRDADVRSALAVRLHAWHPEPDALVVDELDLLGQARVDVAVVNGAMWGYEIKSARDTLRRLPRQVEVYSRVLDFASLVVAESHADQATELVPPWWEVVVISESTTGLNIDRLRSGAPNPRVDAAAVVQLLWRDEAIGLLTERGFDRGIRSKPRRHAWGRLVQHLELPDLQAEVRSCLKARTAWRGPSSRG
jgi:hypothetical protein